LDGRLSRATRIGGIKDFNAKDFGLWEIECKEWGPIVKILLGGEARGHCASEEQLGGLRETLKTAGFSQGLTHVARKSYTLNCNWKVRTWCCIQTRGVRPGAAYKL
jgi:choline monooxygenase